jgi:hypothetical protein
METAMRKLLTFLIALAASISVSASAFAQYAGCLGACGTIAASGAAPFALDGTAQTGTASASSFTTTPFSTTYANDIVYISGQYNGGPITGITGCGLTWTHRASGNFTSGYQELWYAKASSPLVGCAPTVTQTSSSFYNYALLAARMFYHHSTAMAQSRISATPVARLLRARPVMQTIY